MLMLFIGGGADGERREVDERQRAIRVASMPAVNFHHSSLMVEERLSFTEDTYTLRTLAIGEHRLSYYVLQGMRDEEAVARLLTYYRPNGNVRLEPNRSLEFMREYLGRPLNNEHNERHFMELAVQLLRDRANKKLVDALIADAEAANVFQPEQEQFDMDENVPF